MEEPKTITTVTFSDAPSFEITTTVATPEELEIINVLKRLDSGEEQTLPLWMVLDLPYWLTGFLFWAKKQMWKFKNRFR